MHDRRLRTAIVAVAVCCLGLTGAALSMAARPARGSGQAKPKPKRTVIRVTAGKPAELAFKLSKTSKVPAGTVVFAVSNSGALAHDFKICTKPVKRATANQCAGKVTKLLKHGQSATLTVTLTKKGTYEYLCTVPGHAAAGMKGLIGIAVAAPKSPPAKTTPATTTTAASTTTAPPVSKPPATETLIGDPNDGKSVFASAGCGSCHTLAAAGATGLVGPSLDAIARQLTQALIVTQVTNGGMTMPAFGSTLSPAQINDVAAYVYASTHQ